jgi:hypothetical protein
MYLVTNVITKIMTAANTIFDLFEWLITPIQLKQNKSAF